MIKGVIVLAGVLLIAAGANGCSASRITRRKEYSLSTAIHSINLRGYNGEISWKAVEPGAVSRIVMEKEVRGSVSGAMESFLESIQIEDYSTDSEVTLQAVKPQRPWGVTGSAVRFTVYASPDQISKFQAQTSNGSIKVETEFQGSLNLTTSNGPIVLRSGRGSISLRTSNGRIELGEIYLTDSSSAQTSNGRIEGAVVLPRHGHYVFETSNGRIALEMPHDTAGKFDIKTSNGLVEFRLGEETITNQKHLHIRRGDEPTIGITTSNGNISIRGRNMKRVDD